MAVQDAQPRQSSRKRNKALAFAAAGTVLAGSLGIASLAAWTDIEWIKGGVANGDDFDPITASTFEIQQSTSVNPAWDDYEDEAEANLVDFSAAAAALSPGTTVYGYVQLRTITKSLGGDVRLIAHTDVEADELSDALTYGAWVIDGAVTDCEAAIATGTQIVAPGTALNAPADSTAAAGTEFSLAAATPTAPGAVKTVCFAIEFPQSYASSNDLFGQTVSPVWAFEAISVD